MKRRHCIITALSLLLTSTSLFALSGDLGLGTDPLTDGSADHPWRIEDLADFTAFCNDTSKWDSNDHTRLERNLNLASLGTFSAAPIAPDTSTATEHQGPKYSGHFDGNHHILSNMTLNSARYNGLFGYVEPNASIQNLGLSNVNITASSSLTGGLVGEIRSNTTISNCFVTGTINASTYTGGLCGKSSANITNCYVNVNLDMGAYSGTLIGSAGGTIRNCYATGTLHISSSIYVSALCGQNGSLIYDSAWDFNKIPISYAESGPGEAINTYGWTTSEMQTQSNFTDILGWDFENTWTMNGYPIFAWQLEKLAGGRGTADNPYRIESIANFIEFCEDSSFWDGGVYTRLDTNLDLSRIPAFTHAAIGFDTDTDTNFDGHAYSGKFLGNNHTISNLTINGSNHYNALFGYITYSAIISDLTLENCSIIGGGSYTAPLAAINTGLITNCKASGTVLGKSTVSGFCARQNASGRLVKCSSTVTTHGTEGNVGGLVGYNSESITQCHFNGTVTGDNNYVGGLCGTNNKLITQSYVHGQVTGNKKYTGGFCGENNGTIQNCYTSADVSGNDYASGFVSYNSNGTIENCYTTSSVSFTGDIPAAFCTMQYGYNALMTNCFWNEDTCYLPGYKLSPSYPGTVINVQEKNNTELQTQSSFTKWDFIGTDTDGTDDLWRMSALAPGFPILSFQKNIPGDIAGDYGVDLTDFVELAANWQTTYNMNNLADLAEYWLTAK